MSNFIFDFLPSFYRDFMKDENGDNILLPLFNQYANTMGDAVSQAQQIANVLYLEKCPLFIKEYFKTVDIRSSNKYADNCYFIDSNIISFDGLFYDSAFTIPVTNFAVKHDISNNIRYIEFSSALNIIANTLYSPSCTKDKNILQDIFGNLLDYKPLIPSNYHTTTVYNYTTNYNLLVSELEIYRNQLIALMQGLVHGPTYQNMQNSLAIFIGLKYCPFDGIVKSNDGSSIILEDILTEKLITLTGNIDTSLTVGTLVAKYTIVENLNFKLYDIYSDPARFTQYILYNKSENLLDLLNIDTANNEAYAYLNYDSIITFDGDNIYWDMGNNTGVSHTAPGNASNYSHPGISTLNRFDDYTDSRFNNQKIYEMFRNLFIIELPNSNNINNITYFLNRIKSKFTKFKITVVP